MILDIANILMTAGAPGRGNPDKPTVQDGSFLSIMGKAQQSGIEKLKFFQPRTFRSGERRPQAGFQTCMAALRSELLSKGKPFGKLHIGRDDADALTKFLGHCGYSREKSEALIGELLASSSKGEIPMSRFMAKVRESGAPAKRVAQDITLDVSMVPHVASLLKGFDFKEAEIASVLNNGRSANGGLDLQKLIRNLEAAGQKAMRDSRGVADLNSSPQVAETLESLGIKVSGGESAGRMTILDFVRTLQQTSETVQEASPRAADLSVEDFKNLNLNVARHAGQRASVATERPAVPGETAGPSEVPAEVNDTIHRILEKATVSDEIDEDLTAIIRNSKIKFDDPESKKIEGAHSEKNDRSTAADVQKEALAVTRGEGGKGTGSPDAEALRGVAEHNIDPGAKDPVDKKALHGKSFSGVLDMPQEGGPSKGLESAHGLDQKPQPGRNILPQHVIDQLGRQISRSLIRGDGIVQLRLKPVELGSVRLEMQMTEKQMNISVAAENGMVKELLLSNVQELKEMLQGQGIRLDKLDVHVGDDANRAFSDLNGEGAREHSSHRGENGNKGYNGRDEVRDAPFEAGRPARQDAIVDLVA